MAAQHVAGKFGRILRYALPEWRALAVVLGLTLAAAGLAALQPWPLKILVDHALGDGAPPWVSQGLSDLAGAQRALVLIVLAAAASVFVALAHAIVDAGITLAWSRAGQRMVYAVATDLFFQLQRLSLIFHAQRSVGDALSRVTGDAWSVYTVTEAVLITPARQCIVLASIGAVAWHLDPGLTTLVLLAVPLLAASMFFFGQRLRAAGRIQREAQARLTTFVHQVLGAIPVVQAFGTAGRNVALFDRIGADVVKSRQQGALITQAYAGINGVATTVAVALVLYVGGSKVLAREIPLGTLLVFIAYVRSLEGACRGLLQTWGAWKGAEAGVDRVLEVLDADDYVADAPDARPLPPRQPGTSGGIVFDHVTFGYVPERPVLRGLSLAIEPGETLALVGASGAGKTTIASLVPRLVEPWDGRVLLDGIDLRRLQLASLRGEVAMVLQEPFLLPVSVLDNIAYGKPDASREDIVAAAVAANAHEFIRELPHGYDTVVGEQGATLSGGQQQRIAIARALLKDPRVLILDEPTAALDTRTERLVMEALERLMGGRTTIIIAHRLATVRAASRIAVIDDGRIIEIGSHPELLARGGRYARLYALSALGTVPEEPAL